MAGRIDIPADANGSNSNSYARVARQVNLIRRYSVQLHSGYCRSILSAYR